MVDAPPVDMRRHRHGRGQRRHAQPSGRNASRWTDAPDRQSTVASRSCASNHRVRSCSAAWICGVHGACHGHHPDGFRLRWRQHSALRVAVHAAQTADHTQYIGGCGHRSDSASDWMDGGYRKYCAWRVGTLCRSLRLADSALLSAGMALSRGLHGGRVRDVAFA